MTAPDAGGDLRFGVGEIALTIGAAGDRQAGVAAVGIAQRADREPHELVDVADIVGEQHIALEMLGRGAGIMFEPRQAEVGARRVEQRQWAGRVEREVPSAIGNLVADVDQLGRGKPAAELGGGNAVEREIAAVEDIGVGNLAGRRADRNFDRIVAHQML